MNYDERTSLINRQLVNLLSIYAAPKHMETTEKQVDAINRLCESLNKRFPSDTTQEHIVGTFERAGHLLSGSHKTNSWPSSSEITKAVVAGMGREIRQGVTTHVFDTHQINAKRILSGEAVGESWLSGRLGAELVIKNLITKDDLRNYRKSYLAALKKMYGEDYAKDYFEKSDRIFADTIDGAANSLQHQ